MISSEVGSSRSFDGRLDPVVLRLVGRVHMERPASEFLATGYAMPVADRDGVARTGSHEDTPRTKVLEYGHPQPPFSGCGGGAGAEGDYHPGCYPSLVAGSYPRDRLESHRVEDRPP